MAGPKSYGTSFGTIRSYAERRVNGFEHRVNHGMAESQTVEAMSSGVCVFVQPQGAASVRGDDASDRRALLRSVGIRYWSVASRAAPFVRT